MSTNLVFANSTSNNVSFSFVDSGNHTYGPYNCSPYSASSGTVSGASSYKVMFATSEYLSAPRFTGDTEITFIIFAQPVNESNEPLAEEDSAAAPPADGGDQY